MPASIVKSFAKRSGRSESEVEKLWASAKDYCTKYRNLSPDDPKFYPCVVGILKKWLKLEGFIGSLPGEYLTEASAILERALVRHDAVAPTLYIGYRKDGAEVIEGVKDSVADLVAAVKDVIQRAKGYVAERPWLNAILTVLSVMFMPGGTSLTIYRAVKALRARQAAQKQLAGKEIADSKMGPLECLVIPVSESTYAVALSWSGALVLAPIEVEESKLTAFFKDSLPSLASGRAIVKTTTATYGELRRILNSVSQG